MPDKTANPDTWSIARNVSPHAKKKSRNRRSSRKNPYHGQSHKTQDTGHNQEVEIAGAGSQFDADQGYIDYPDQISASDLVE